MKAMVTGGAGFIGSHLVEALLQRGTDVVVFDNLSTGSVEHLSGCMDEIEFIEADIRSEPDLRRAFSTGVDVVFHLAAHISVSDSMKNPALCLDINVHGTNLLLQTAAQTGVKKVVISSSAAVYGDQQQLPITESALLQPLSPYGASKQMDETLAALYTRSFNLPVVCLRYFNAFGPRQNPDSPYAAAIPIFFQRVMQNEEIVVYGDGNQTRDFVYVKDIARANILSAESTAADGMAVNICSGVPTSIRQLINGIRELIPGSREPRYEPARAGDIYHSYGDPTLAKKLLDFSAETELDSGLKQTMDWMRI